jgi:hypothetical protein
MWIRPSAYCQGMQGENKCKSTHSWQWYWTDVILRMYAPGRSNRCDGTHWVGEKFGSRPYINITKNTEVFIMNYKNRRFLYWDSGKTPQWLTSPRPTTYVCKLLQRYEWLLLSSSSLSWSWTTFPVPISHIQNALQRCCRTLPCGFGLVASRFCSVEGLLSG